MSARPREIIAVPAASPLARVLEYRKTGSRPVVAAFVWSRIALILAAYAVSFMVPDPPRVNRWIYPLTRLAGWDGGHYLLLVRDGYLTNSADAIRFAFFPLWPLTIKAVHFLLPVIEPWVIGIILANLFSFGAVLAFRTLVLRESGSQSTANRAATYLALFPSSYVLSMVYAEGLFLLLTILFFSHLRRSNWEMAGLLGLLAGLCRAHAVFLTVGVAFEALSRWRAASTRRMRMQALACLSVAIGPVMGILHYARYVAFRTDDALFSLHVQKRVPGWKGEPRFFLNQILLHDIPDLWHNGVKQGFLLGLIVLLALATAIYACRRLPSAYSSYAIVSLAVATSAVNAASNDRYVLVLFPLFWALALLGRRSFFDAGYRAAAPLLLGMVAIASFMGRWVP